MSTIFDAAQFETGAGVWLVIMLDSAVKGAVWLLAAAALVAALARASASVRHLIWSLALGGLSSEPLSLLLVGVGGVGEVAVNHGLLEVQLRGHPPVGVAADCEQRYRWGG